MSHWNYRIVRYADRHGYGLHEVYYDDNGRPDGMTKEPAWFGCDDDQNPQEEIAAALELALKDVRDRPIFDEPKEWGRKDKLG